MNNDPNVPGVAQMAMANFIAPAVPAAVANAPADLEGGITAAHIAGCFPEDGKLKMDYFNVNVLPLLTAERNVIRNRGLTHSINCNNYDNVYVTSDIHADYRKLLQTLVDNNLITLPAGFPRQALYPVRGANGVVTDRIYEPALITGTTWNNPRTCLIILGDIVDGQRLMKDQYGYVTATQEVDDPRGQFEMLIHMFLFNLRRRALAQNSLIAFTLGNHDYHSVITPITNDWLQEYVHRTARELYQRNHVTRMNALLPFYDIYPLFFVSIICPQKEGREEMVGIHAGFHDNHGNDLTRPIRLIQAAADALIMGETLNTLPKAALDAAISMPGGDGGLWSRRYDRHDICATLTPLAPKLFVVGHCNTIIDEKMSMPDGTRRRKRHSLSKFENNDAYRGCFGHSEPGVPDIPYENQRGCVVLSCNNKLAHVDVGMSASFYPMHPTWRGITETSTKEMLHLSHNPALSIEDRFYNVVRRVSTNVNTEMFREAAPAAPPAAPPAGNGAAVGGYKKHRRMSKRRKSSRRAKRTYRRRR